MLRKLRPSTPTARCRRAAAVTTLAILAAPLLASTDGDDGPPSTTIDGFHPTKGDGATPLYGGRVIVHLPSLPESMCFPIENSSYTRHFLHEVHETLLIEDWWTTEWTPSAAASWVEEDLVVLAEGAPETPGEFETRVARRDGEPGQRAVRAVYGSVEEAGDAWRVTPVSENGALAEPIDVPKSSVERIERGTVFTIKLREGVKWHPSLVYEGEALQSIAGQTLDSEDVRFSWSIYGNPEVDCDQKRFQFEKIVDCQVVDPLTVRFFYEQQYAFAILTIGDSLTLLPSHIYNLSDPDCPDHDERATASAQAEHINENPHNKLWVGIGPYRVTEWSQQYVEADRFVDGAGKLAYFDAAKRPGYVDTIRWRCIPDDEAAMNALLNGELDYFNRVKSEDYFEGRTLAESFTEGFYKGFYYPPNFGYTAWNLYSPKLSDPAVRKAITHAFDFEAYAKNQYNGLVRHVTGPVPFDSEGYDHELAPLENDEDIALDLLEDAGWYDRNGDGVADKDGVELTIEFLYPAGNDASKLFGRALQAAVKDLGIEIQLASLEWATMLERVKSREFESVNLAWSMPLESDPEQLWHSKWGERDRKSSNNAGLRDAEIDRLIGAIQYELDEDARMSHWREFHRRLYDIQPYLFMYNVPRKFGASKKLRGLRFSPIDPGYVIRDWYYVDPSVPGTRKSLAGG
ncbi:MAG: ABC transporter substrate-binding protein [Planctomycetota bacterium]